MSGSIRIARHGAWLAAMTMAAGLAAAQEPKVRPAEGAPIGRPGETTLFMMVRTGPHLTEDKLERTLSRGLNKAGCDIDGKPIIRSISPAVFEEIESLTNKTAGKVADAPVLEGFGVRRLPLRDQYWEFHLRSPSQVLKRLKISYRAPDGKDVDKEYQPADPKESGPLTLIVPGTYALRLEPAHEPLGYEAEVVELGEKPEVIKNKWPASDRFYVITMRNFKGDRDVLFRTLKDPREVPNPLDSIRMGSDLVFVFANLEATGASVGDLFAGNNLILSGSAPLNRSAARCWMLFPLTETAARDQLVEFRKIKDEEKLVQEIRKNAVRANENLEVGPDTKPQWVEVTELMPGRFRREIPLRDFKGLLEKYPSVYSLLVWEFDDGRPAAITIKLPDGPEVLVLDQEIKRWATSLQEKIGAGKKN